MDKIGRYEIQGMVGRGAMGVVHKAFDPQLERYAAIKVMNTVGPVGEELRVRFFHEARSAAKLNHPTIISVYDLGEDQGVPYIAMEYLEGEDLKALIENQTFVPFDQKISIVLAVCEGLDYAHSHGVVHRDIKPANIFVTKEARPKIVDFGVARLMASDLTESGSIIGSPYYMSPEQVKGADVDGRSDIFSIGVLLYEWICQRRPFEGDTPTAVCFRIISEAHTPIPEILPGCSPELAKIIDRALCKDREERYRTGAEMAAELAGFAERLPRTQTVLKKEIEGLEKKFREQKQNLSDPVVEDLVAGRLQLDATENPDDYGNQLVRHADLSKASQILGLRRERETLLQLSAALAVARNSLERGDFERCLKAVSAVFAVVPSHAEALVIKRRALLQQKVGGRPGKTGGTEKTGGAKGAVRTAVGLEELPEVKELLDFARSEVDRGNLQTGLRNTSFLLQLDPAHPRASQLKERTEAAIGKAGTSGERLAQARGGETVVEATQQVEAYDATQLVRSQKKTRERLSRSFPRLSPATIGRLIRLAAGVTALALVAAVAFWAYGLLVQRNQGTLILNVVPWAHVDSITNVESGQAFPIEENLAAPCVITLPEGNYRVRVSHPGSAQTAEFDVSIDSAVPSAIQKTLPGINLEREITNVLGQ